MSFLQLDGKTVVVCGVANRKSVAYHVGKTLEESGAQVVYIVRSEERRDSLNKLLANREIYVCDVEHQDQIDRVQAEVAERHPVIDGLLHSIAFAD